MSKNDWKLIIGGDGGGGGGVRIKMSWGGEGEDYSEIESIYIFTSQFCDRISITYSFHRISCTQLAGQFQWTCSYGSSYLLSTTINAFRNIRLQTMVSDKLSFNSVFRFKESFKIKWFVLQMYNSSRFL